MRASKTFKGIEFTYEGSIDEDLILYSNRTKVKHEIIDFIKEVISKKGEIKVGASRTNPPPNSLGFILQETKGVSPGYLSHILPLLEENGFITHWKDNGYWVKKRG